MMYGYGGSWAFFLMILVMIVLVAAIVVAVVFAVRGLTPGGQTGTQPVSLDAIQEIQVLVSPYDVKQGGFSGGGVNAITKSGSNNFHGTAYDFFRNENFMGKIPQVGTYANPNPGSSIVGAFSDKQ